MQSEGTSLLKGDNTSMTLMMDGSIELNVNLNSFGFTAERRRLVSLYTLFALLLGILKDHVFVLDGGTTLPKD